MTGTGFFAIDTFRTPVAVEGEDRQAFLQGLISNDTRRVTETHAVYSAFLTPQGKFLHDFSVAETGGRWRWTPNPKSVWKARGRS